MSDLKTNQDGFIINEKYKPKIEEQIENNRICAEFSYRDCLHYAYIQVEKSDLDDEIKKKVIEGLRRIFLRAEI